MWSCFGRKSQIIAPKEATQSDDNVVTDIRRIANVLVSNNLISKENAAEQVDAVRLFTEGKMSYAEMRMRAG